MAVDVKASFTVTQSHCPTVLLAGCYQNGKSTFINCLLSGKYAIEGQGLATTTLRTIYQYSPKEVQYYQVNEDGSRTSAKSGLQKTIERTGNADHFVVEANVELLKHMKLIDAPGWGAGDEDDKQSELSLDGVDFVVYIAQPRELSQSDKAFLRLLREKRTYFCVLLNARDTTSPDDLSLQNVCGAIEGAIRHCGLEDQFIRFPANKGIGIVNFLWVKYGSHLLDEPINIHEERQKRIAIESCELEPATAHNELMQFSGWNGWLPFFMCAVELVPGFLRPSDCAIHKKIVSSLCDNLASILKER